MSILPILRFPDTRLRTIAKPVTNIDETIHTLIDNMFDSMYAERGVGLAATQVNVHQRIVVADCASEKEAPQPISFINPEIISASDELEICQEGCLSIPDIFADVERACSVTVKALDSAGNEFTKECDGLLAVCIQHEIDHLNGKLFVDYLSAAKRNLIRDKMKKYEKQLLKESKQTTTTT
ncbi:MAG: peptide deformylase [Ostreibacterium sp.]